MLLWSHKTTGRVEDTFVSSDGSCVVTQSGAMVFYFSVDIEGCTDIIGGAKGVMESDNTPDVDPVMTSTPSPQPDEASTTEDDMSAGQLTKQDNLPSRDTDGNGVSNNSDSAPTVNNYYIYAGGILLVGLVITLRKGLKAKERRHKDRMKQEILDMIDEINREE